MPKNDENQTFRAKTEIEGNLGQNRRISNLSKSMRITEELHDESGSSSSDNSSLSNGAEEKKVGGVTKRRSKRNKDKLDSEEKVTSRLTVVQNLKMQRTKSGGQTQYAWLKDRRHSTFTGLTQDQLKSGLANKMSQSIRSRDSFAGKT